MTNPRDADIDQQLTKVLDLGLKVRDKISDRDSYTKGGAVAQLDYQEFYTISCALVKQLAPHRYEEYVGLYMDGKRRHVDIDTYNISDLFNNAKHGMFDPYKAAGNKIFRQISILHSIRNSLGSLLLDLRVIITADLFDSEIASCRALAKAKHHRAAGALAGVLLEKHLGNVAQNRSLAIAKKNPTLADFNEAMKNANVVDLVQWRGIQRLADIRNLASHAKDREPTPEEINELIDGVDRIMKTLL